MATNIEKVRLRRVDDHMNFEATGKYGGKILMDGGPDIGGKGNGVSPMETLLMAAAGCSSIDVVLILEKMRQEASNIEIEVTAERVKKEDASYYKTIHLDFILEGDLKESKVYQAIELSVTKYCSVIKILEYSAIVTAAFSINHGPSIAVIPNSEKK